MISALLYLQLHTARNRLLSRLRPAGPQFMALFWKNLIAAGRVFSVGFWLLLVWLAVFGGILLTAVARDNA